MLLENKIAIVTGGSRGIGYAIVDSFLTEGACVVLCASRQETAKRAVEQLKETHPDAAVEGIWPDLSDYAQVKEAFDKVAEKYGGIDILVNNAGVSENTPFTKYTDETMDRLIDLNVKGVYHCARAVVEHMEAQGNGVILNTSSMVSIYGQPAGVAYPTSKGNPRQCGGAGNYQYRYDAGGSEKCDRTDDRADPAAPYGRTAGCRERVCISCVGKSILYYGRCTKRRRAGKELIVFTGPF